MVELDEAETDKDAMQKDKNNTEMIPSPVSSKNLQESPTSPQPTDSNNGKNQESAQKLETDNNPPEEPKITNPSNPTTQKPSKTDRVKPKRSRFRRFWNSIFKFFANDAIHGSFVGPHPVSFIGCCRYFRCCKGTCTRPFILASVATKFMWFIMLIIVILLSCFFIIPYKVTPDTFVSIADMYPCMDRNGTQTAVFNNITMDCTAHAGYFMVYRNFFAFILLLLINCLISIGVNSTKKHRKRAKIFHGFWFYKYMTLFGLLLISYLAIPVADGGIFEYIMSWLGLLAFVVFSFPEIVFILDLVEIWVVKNANSESDWSCCLYYTFAAAIFLIDGLILAALFEFYIFEQYPKYPGMNVTEPIHANSLHLGVWLYAIIMFGSLMGFEIYWIVRRLRNNVVSQSQYPTTLQTTFVIAYMLSLVWSALENSPELTSRPHTNDYLAAEDGNKDTYYKSDGLFQVALAMFTLVYHLFWHSPRSETAPLSKLYDFIVHNSTKKPEVPVMPKYKKNRFEINDDDDPLSSEFTDAVLRMRVWDDEKVGVRYSWSLFFAYLIIASLVIMMGLCNFSDPWAVEWYSSSYPALGVKIFVSFYTSALYVATISHVQNRNVPVAPVVVSTTQNNDTIEASREINHEQVMPLDVPVKIDVSNVDEELTKLE